MSNVAQENAPLLNAIGLKKYYPVKKGMFAKTPVSYTHLMWH